MNLMNVRLLPILVALVALSATSARAQQIDREFPQGGMTTLRLNVSGNVHMMPSADAQTIKFHVVDYGPPVPQVRFTESRIGKRLTISLTGPSEGLLPFTGPSGYELQVIYPASMQLDLREFSGTVQADHLVGATQIYDANGDVTINGALGAITAESDDGSVTLTDAHANVQLTSANGAVKAQLASGWRGDLIRIESSNGALSLTVPPGFRGDYDLTTAEGAVHNALRTVKGAPVVFMLTQSGDVSVATNSASGGV
jgi:hypothetical protein